MRPNLLQDFLDQLKAEKRREKSSWIPKIDIEIRDSSEEPPENVVVLDDHSTTQESSNIKQVTFNTTTTFNTTQDESSPELPPKKTSRVVWQDHVEVME